MTRYRLRRGAHVVDETVRRTKSGDYVSMVFERRVQAETFGIHRNRRENARAGESWIAVPTSSPDTSAVPECVRGRWERLQRD